jgi:hypothetical protein
MTQTTNALRAYMSQRGLFARVAKKLDLDPSYVSRVAHGQRYSTRISLAIEAELKKLHISRRRNARSPRKRPRVPTAQNRLAARANGDQ